ncbi:MAG: hypothetical protein AAF193_01395, partial [Bacteroidota bacterium]
MTKIIAMRCLQKAAALLLLCLITNLSYSQVTGVELEVVQEHTGLVGTTDLTGFTTYRLYATCTNTNDFISAVTGLNTYPMEITTTGTFFQSAFGENEGGNINPGIAIFVPDVLFDSWVTIDRESSADPGISLTLLQSDNDPWITSFSGGGDIVIDGDIGGGWFQTFSENAASGFAGDDLRVLIGQFTTDGELNGIINIQCFFLGDNDNDQRLEGVPFSSNAGAVFGCTDPSALNYDPTANVDDGSCQFPCTLQIDSATPTAPTCSDSDDGSISVVASGAQGAAFYQLDGGPQIAVPQFNGLSPGTYMVTVTDG